MTTSPVRIETARDHRLAVPRSNESTSRTRVREPGSPILFFTTASASPQDRTSSARSLAGLGRRARGLTDPVFATAIAFLPNLGPRRHVGHVASLAHAR